MKFISKSAILSLAVVTAVAIVPTLAQAAKCGNGPAGFNAWRTAFKKESSGSFSSSTLKVLDGITYNKTVVRLDRNQKHGKRKSFAAYAAKKVTKGRISKGKKLLRQNAKLLKSIERKYGVPGPVLVAIWGLETDFGSNQGRMSAVRSLATLAYDCRRSAFFTNELNSALSIIQRGYMKASAMKGAWAGELGQTQFLASSYLKYAVDYDRNGRRDLVNSKADVLASTANYLRSYGWKRGGAYGPGSANARVFAGWNKSTNYQKTIALFASKLGK